MIIRLKVFVGLFKTAAVLKNSAAVFEKTARVFGETYAVCKLMSVR